VTVALGREFGVVAYRPGNRPDDGERVVEQSADT
jgi:hypothetical protein